MDKDCTIFSLCCSRIKGEVLAFFMWNYRLFQELTDLYLNVLFWKAVTIWTKYRKNYKHCISFSSS